MNLSVRNENTTTYVLTETCQYLVHKNYFLLWYFHGIDIKTQISCSRCNAQNDQKVTVAIDSCVHAFEIST